YRPGVLRRSSATARPGPACSSATWSASASCWSAAWSRCSWASTPQANPWKRSPSHSPRQAADRPPPRPPPHRHWKRRETRQLLTTTLLSAGGGGWYRYHPLFAEVLLLKLRREHPGRGAGLHRRN